MFKLTLECNNTVYNSKGETILDCLNNLPLDWIEVKTKGTITVTDGKHTSSKFMSLALLRKVVASKLTKVVWSKNLKVLMK